MTREDLRLELLRLTYHAARPAGEAVERAKDLEKYILEEAKSEPALQIPEVKTKGKKSVGNPDILT